MKSILLLYDIDGTLLKAPGVGRILFEKSFLEITGFKVDLQTLDWYGRTDMEIINNQLRNLGFQNSDIDLYRKKIFDFFLKEQEEFIKTNKDKFVILPYVRDMLEKNKKYPTGLVTGNIMISAYRKLSVVGIDKYFPFKIGAFGDESENRNDLPPLALKRAKEYYNMDFDKVIIIGDSPKDIECAKYSGFLSIIIVTGKIPYETMISHNPDYCLKMDEAYKIPDIIDEI